jgi:hypothetical protein
MRFNTCHAFGEPLPTRQEFRDRLEAARREECRVGIAWLVFFFAALFAQLPFYHYVVIPTHSPLAVIAQIVELFLLIAGNVALMIWYFRTRARRFKLLCPGCKAALHGAAGEYAAQWGNCPVCRAAVWSGENSASDFA